MSGRPRPQLLTAARLGEDFEILFHIDGKPVGDLHSELRCTCELLGTTGQMQTGSEARRTEASVERRAVTKCEKGGTDPPNGFRASWGVAGSRGLTSDFGVYLGPCFIACQNHKYMTMPYVNGGPDGGQGRRRLRWELIILGCMYVGYMGFILCRTAIYVASPAMVEDPALGLTKTMFGAILGWGTAGMVTGKLLGGAVADRFGGRTVFLLALSVTTAAAAGFAVAGGFVLFCLLNFAMLLSAAAGWPAMSKLIAAWYEPDRYAKVWGVISTSSRLSSVLSTLVLGRLLLLTSWPKVFVAAAALAAAVIAAIFLFLKAGPADAGLPPPSAGAGGEAKSHPLDGTGLREALLHFARSGRVWLMCVSLMCTTVLMEVIGFLPLYLKETLHISPAQAATASSVFPAGCLVALLAGGWVYDRVPRRGRPLLLGGMLVFAALCLGALFAMGRASLAPETAFAADGRRAVPVRAERGPILLSADERVLHRVRRPALRRPDRAHRCGGLRRGHALPVRRGRDRGSTGRLAEHARAPVRRLGARDGLDGLVRTRGRGGMSRHVLATLAWHRGCDGDALARRRA